MRERQIQSERQELKPEHWKNFTVSVMSASSNENKPAVQNAREVGRMLPGLGMDGINGGYSVGGMGSFAEGYKEGSRALGMTDEEIQKHLKGVVYSEKVIGSALAQQRGINSPASITTADSLPQRAGGIILGSDVVIAVEGGLGTNIEALLAAQDQWFRDKNKDVQLPIRPTILIESTNLVEETVALNENKVPGSINNITPHVYVLSGHSNPNIKRNEGGLGMATLENDPLMKEKLQMLLEYFHQKREKDLGNPYHDMAYNDLEEKLFKNGGKYKVLTLLEKLEAKKNMHGYGEGI